MHRKKKTHKDRITRGTTSTFLGEGASHPFLSGTLVEHNSGPFPQLELATAGVLNIEEKNISKLRIQI